jgi:hypothetical protein
MEQIIQVVWDIDENTLKEYEEKVSQKKLIHVFYDPEHGNIKVISGESNESTLPYISLSQDEINTIIDGTKPMHEYKVVFSPDEKDFILIHVDEEEEVLQSIHDVIYQYPFKIDTSKPLEIDPTNDITVIQDYNDSCWKFYINGNLASKLSKKKMYFDNIHELYVTEANDPNILYKIMRLPLKDLITNFYYIIPFDDIDYNEVKISIFSRKLFSKYQYIKNKL